MEEKLKAIYQKLLENRKVIVRECARNWGIQKFMTFRATTGWQQEAYIKYARTRPTWGDHILTMGRVIHATYLVSKDLYGTGGRLSVGGLNALEHLELFEALTKRWQKRIENKVPTIPLSKRNRNSSTENIKELLARGFVHESDITWEEEDGNYAVVYEDFGLAYPREFAAKATAQEFLDNFGLRGCTINQI